MHHATAPDVLFIGLGAMGRELARRLATLGIHKIALHDISTEAVTKLVPELRGSRAFDVLEASPLPSVIFTCLPHSGNVGQVIDALIPRMVPKTLWIDCTSGDPIKTREYSDLLSKHGSILVDVAVSGGPQGAADGALTAMVGCPDALFDTVVSFVQPFARNIVRCGGTGAGHAVKAINNIIMGTNLLVASEGLCVLSKYGVQPADALKAINESSGRSWATINRIPKHVLPGTYDYGFQLSLLQKDMLTALRLAAVTGSTTPLFSRSFHITEHASKILGDNADHTRLSEAVAHLQSANLQVPSIPGSQAPSMRALGIKLVVFDCAGTVIDEGGLVYKVLDQIMRGTPGSRITYTSKEFELWHGCNKVEALRFFGSRAGMSEEEVQVMYKDFLSTLEAGYFDAENAGFVKLIPGTFELFKALGEAGIKVCLNTGYPRSIAERLIQMVGLEEKIDDLVVAEDVGMGRPYPYMIHYLARKHNIMDMRHIAKLGDAVRDIEEGLFAGCGFVAGVLTGADSFEEHLRAGAHLVFRSIADLCP